MNKNTYFVIVLEKEMDEIRAIRSHSITFDMKKVIPGIIMLRLGKEDVFVDTKYGSVSVREKIGKKVKSHSSKTWELVRKTHNPKCTKCSLKLKAQKMSGLYKNSK